MKQLWNDINFSLIIILFVSQWFNVLILWWGWRMNGEWDECFMTLWNHLIHINNFRCKAETGCEWVIWATGKLNTVGKSKNMNRKLKPCYDDDFIVEEGGMWNENFIITFQYLFSRTRFDALMKNELNASNNFILIWRWGIKIKVSHYI